MQLLTRLIIFSFFVVIFPGADSPKKTDTSAATVIVGGTVVLARGVNHVIAQTGDVDWSWQGIAPLLKSADLAIVNLKSPLIPNYQTPTSKLKLYAPQKNGQGMVHSGVKLVSFSGNHSGDAGEQGILDTLQTLQTLGISFAGAGSNRTQAYAPVYFRLPNGVRVGFLAFNSIFGSSLPARNSDDPGGEQIGVSWLKEEYTEPAIKKAKSESDFVMVLVNWGTEYTVTPNADQEQWAKKMVDAGADLIVGDQAHWVQKVQYYKGKLVAYGLGNLIFDQYWSSATREGLLLKLNFSGRKLQKVYFIPVYLQNDGVTRVTTDPGIIRSIQAKAGISW